MAQTKYPIAIEPRFRLLLRVLFGVTSERAWVELSEDQLTARFGWYTFAVPIDQITSCSIEGPWRWITAIGVRRSIRHGDVSFAGGTCGGVRLDLRAPVKWTIFRVPAFYVGVADLAGFAAALSTLGIPGDDAREAIGGPEARTGPGEGGPG